MIHDILVVFQVMVCVALIGLILIQHGKGAEAGAAFGSGASATVFGSQGSASFLTRITAVLATLFFINSLALAYFVGQRTEPKSVMEKVQPAAPPGQSNTSEPVKVPAPSPSDLPPVPTPQGSTGTPPAAPASQTGANPTPAPVGPNSQNNEVTPTPAAPVASTPAKTEVTPSPAQPPVSAPQDSVPQASVSQETAATKAPVETMPSTPQAENNATTVTPSKDSTTPAPQNTTAPTTPTMPSTPPVQPSQ